MTKRDVIVEAIGSGEGAIAERTRMLFAFVVIVVIAVQFGQCRVQCLVQVGVDAIRRRRR